MLQNASWCPTTHRCGGAVVVVYPKTLCYQIYKNPIPLWLGNSYAAKLYMAWVVFTFGGPAGALSFAYCSSSWHFADCQSYISSQQGRSGLDNLLQEVLMQFYRELSDGHSRPQHLSSCISGTWLDDLVDVVDKGAAKVAECR